MKIDMHAHCVPRDCFNMIDEDGRPFGPTIEKDADGREIMIAEGMNLGPIVSLIADPEIRIKEMDRTGIDMQAISMTPTSLYDNLPPDRGLRLCCRYNDCLAGWVKNYPDRFAGLASLPMQDISLAVGELERAVNVLGFRGVQIISNINGKNLDNREIWPFYAKVQALNVPIFVHPWQVAGLERMQKYFLANTVGNPAETALAIGSIIFGGVLEEFPRLKLVFAHAGGAAPYIRGRWEHGYRSVKECRSIPKPPSEYFKLIYCDTVVHSPAALAYLVQEIGADKIALGTDYPFEMGDLDPVHTIRWAHISAADKETIMERTAARLLNIKT